MRFPVLLRLAFAFLLPAALFSATPDPSPNTPAFAAAKKFMRGANLGNYLEAPPGQNWGATYSVQDFVHLCDEGFDHVRLPIAWHHYAGPGPEFKLSDTIFARVDFLVTNALQHRLAVIVNIHHFDPFTTRPAEETSRFYALWRQIAEHYKTFPDTVAFELLNEPKDAATTPALNPIYAEALRIIRRSNPQRTIFVGPGKWNQVGELADLKLPKDDRLIVTVHCYDPFYFTHQGASWAGPDTKATGIQFPGPPATPLVPDPELNLRPGVLNWIKRYNTAPAAENPSSPAAFLPVIKKAADWSRSHGVPVHFGEFGCYTGADPVSRSNFYRAFRQALKEPGMGWCVWDWKAGFRYWDDSKNQPAPGMREALFSE